MSDNKIGDANMENHHIGELISYNMKYLKECKNKKMTGISTGWEGIDSFSSGFQNSDLIIFASRPNMRTRILVNSIVRHIGKDSNIPVAILSLELTKEQLSLHMLWSESQVEIPLIRHGIFHEGDWSKLDEAARALSKAPIFLMDSHGDSIKDILSNIRDMVQKHNVKIIFIDHFQLIRKELDQ